MSKSPPVPPEQRSFRGPRPDVAGSTQGRHDEKTGLQSDQPGDGDVNLREQGRQGNLRQNVSAVQHRVQDR